MKEKERPEEKNIEMLLKAGYPEEGRLDPRLRVTVYSRLVKAMKARPVFPPLALVLICVTLLLLAAILIGAAIGELPFVKMDLLIYLAGGVLLLNLLCLPVASILIVIRRKHA